MSHPSRFYIEVQDYLRERLEANDLPKTVEIQQTVFGRSFDPDSQYQKQIIRDRIAEGRKNALEQWELYCGCEDFEKDIKKIEYYDNKKFLGEDEDDYHDFYSALLRGRFGEDSEEIMEYLNEYIIISKLWKEKLPEFSKNLNNLVISTYGQNARWFCPSWWRWAIRETNLYLRTIRILRRQLKRGESTKLLTASGEPIQKAIGYTRSIEGMLEDGTSWKCPDCGMYNHGKSNFCSNCSRRNPNRKDE